MEEEAIPALLPQPSNTTTDLSAADLDEPTGVNADIPNASEDIVVEPLAIMQKAEADLQEQQVATQQFQSIEPFRKPQKSGNKTSSTLTGTSPEL